jgi:hypothetical protein
MKHEFVLAHIMSEGAKDREPFCFPWPLPGDTFPETIKKIEADKRALIFSAVSVNTPLTWGQLEEQVCGAFRPGRLFYDIYGDLWRVASIPERLSQAKK